MQKMLRSPSPRAKIRPELLINNFLSTYNSSHDKRPPDSERRAYPTINEDGPVTVLSPVGRAVAYFPDFPGCRRSL